MASALLYRDGAAQGPLSPAAGSWLRHAVAQRSGAHHQRDRANLRLLITGVVVVRGGLRLPRPRGSLMVDSRVRTATSRLVQAVALILRRGLCRPQPHPRTCFRRITNPRLMHARGSAMGLHHLRPARAAGLFAGPPFGPLASSAQGARIDLYGAGPQHRPTTLPLDRGLPASLVIAIFTAGSPSRPPARPTSPEREIVGHPCFSHGGRRAPLGHDPERARTLLSRLNLRRADTASACLRHHGAGLFGDAVGSYPRALGPRLDWRLARPPFRPAVAHLVDALNVDSPALIFSLLLLTHLLRHLGS